MNSAINANKTKNIKKKIIISICIILAILLTLLLLVGFALTDRNICGFVGMWGVVRLSLGNDYVRLTNNTQQYIVHSNDFHNSVPLLFDIYEVSGSLTFRGYINGYFYSAQGRAFTRRYTIVTFDRITN